MKKEELEEKLIRKILRGRYLEGCTMRINEDGSDDIYECDIINAIKEMKGEFYDWD